MQDKQVTQTQTHKITIEASDPEFVEALLRASQPQIIAASHPPLHPHTQYLPAVAPNISASQGNQTLHSLTIPLALFCLIGGGLLVTPQGNKTWDSLPAVKGWQQTINGNQPKTSTKSAPPSQQNSSDLIFPLAGYSGQTKKAGSIPGDCRPLGACTRRHAGVDYGAPPGWPVLSIEDGVVSEVNPDSGVGGIIGIRTASQNEVYRYVHLDRSSVRPFRIGQKVKKGQVIGLIGPTFAGSSAPHLHLERYLNGALDWNVHKRFENAVKVSKP